MMISIIKSLTCSGRRARMLNMDTPKPVHIYTLRDPRDHKVYYVGKTVDPKVRMTYHRRAHEKGVKRRLWLAELRTLGLRPIMEIVEVVPIGEQWQPRE